MVVLVVWNIGLVNDWKRLKVRYLDDECRVEIEEWMCGVFHMPQFGWHHSITCPTSFHRKTKYSNRTHLCQSYIPPFWSSFNLKDTDKNGSVLSVLLHHQLSHIFLRFLFHSPPNHYSTTHTLIKNILSQKHSISSFLLSVLYSAKIITNFYPSAKGN